MEQRLTNFLQNIFCTSIKYFLVSGSVDLEEWSGGENQKSNLHPDKKGGAVQCEDLFGGRDGSDK